MTGQLTVALILSVCVGGNSVTSLSDCASAKAIEFQGHAFLATIIPCSYVKEYRPPTDPGRAVNVDFTMFIQDINSINAEDMDFRVDLFLHMTWEDTRLNLSSLEFIEGQANSHDHITLPSYVIDHIWTPDPYVTNSKDAAITKLTTTYASVTIYRNHTIKYSARVYSIVGCQMEFHEYPMDVQTCLMILESFMYSPREVEFNWRPWSPVTINRELKLLQFSLKKPLRNYVNITTHEDLGHSVSEVRRLVVELEFSRAIGHHLVQTFVPSFLVVALSWFSFWLGLEAIPGRVTLLVTSLLTLTTLFTGIKEGLPPVAYIKAIDVWMAGCMVFVFAALGEFVVVRVLNVMHLHHQVAPTLVQPAAATHLSTPINGQAHEYGHGHAKYAPGTNYLRRMTLMEGQEQEEDSEKVIVQNAKLSQIMENGTPRLTLSGHTRQGGLMSAWDAESASVRPKSQKAVGRISLHWIDAKTGERRILWKEIDKASRIVFPLMFLLFMVIYFPILISRSF